MSRKRSPDLTGRRFGLLTVESQAVLEYGGKRQSGCSIEDFDLGDPCYRNFEEWEAEQAEQEYFNRDKAFLI